MVEYYLASTTHAGEYRVIAFAVGDSENHNYTKDEFSKIDFGAWFPEELKFGGVHLTADDITVEKMSHISIKMCGGAVVELVCTPYGIDDEIKIVSSEKNKIFAMKNRKLTDDMTPKFTLESVVMFEDSHGRKYVQVFGTKRPNGMDITNKLKVLGYTNIEYRDNVKCRYVKNSTSNVTRLGYVGVNQEVRTVLMRLINAIGDVARGVTKIASDDVVEVPQEKPPIGLRPRIIWSENIRKERMNEITAAMERYIKGDKTIPLEWLTEMKEHIEFLCRK